MSSLVTGRLGTEGDFKGDPQKSLFWAFQPGSRLQNRFPRVMSLASNLGARFLSSLNSKDSVNLCEARRARQSDADVKHGIHSQLRPKGWNRRGETRLRGPEVSGPFKGLGFRPLVSVIRGLGNTFPEAP